MRLTHLAILYLGGIVSGIYLQQNYRGVPDVGVFYREWSNRLRQIEQMYRLKN